MELGAAYQARSVLILERTPEETAVSIAAEIVGQHWGGQRPSHQAERPNTPRIVVTDLAMS